MPRLHQRGMGRERQPWKGRADRQGYAYRRNRLSGKRLSPARLNAEEHVGSEDFDHLGAPGSRCSGAFRPRRRTKARPPIGHDRAEGNV